MKAFLTALIFFNSASLWAQTSCPATPAYFHKGVCSEVQKSSIKFKLDLLRLKLTGEAMKIGKINTLNEYCQVKLSYSVCGPAFVGKNLAEEVLGSSNMALVKFVVQKSGKDISKNSEVIRKILTKNSVRELDDEKKVLLYQNGFKPEGEDLLEFSQSFRNEKNIPEDIKKRAQEVERLESLLNDAISKKQSSQEDWKTIFKNYPELLVKSQKKIKPHSPASLSLEFLTLTEEEKPKARLDFLTKKIKAYSEGTSWDQKETEDIKGIANEAPPLTTENVLILLEGLAKNKEKKDFPESFFWALFEKLKEEELTEEHKNRLMVLLYQIDNKTWVTQAFKNLSVMETYIADRMEGPCEIEPVKLRSYFTSSYQKYKEKQMNQFYDQAKKGTSNPEQLLALIDQEFNPLTKVNGSDFLDFFATGSLKKLPLAQKKLLFQKACQRGDCPSRLAIKENSPIAKAVMAGNAEEVRIMFEYLRSKHWVHDSSDKRLLKKLNRNNKKSQAIEEALKVAKWI